MISLHLATGADPLDEWATTIAGMAARHRARRRTVIIDSHAVNTAPVIDLVGAVVCAADISNVRTVPIDGQIRKHDRRLVAYLDGPRRLVEESPDYLVSRVEPQEGWVSRRERNRSARAGPGPGGERDRR